jgi:uncharacterized protein
MKNWKLVLNKKNINLKKTILIEGLPGIGNIGKIIVDFVIDEIKAEKIGEFRSNTIPTSIFLNNDDEVEMPIIEVYHKKWKKKNLLFLSGDMQPITEESCHDFCETILDEFKENEIITIGGIAKKTEPKKPKVYCAGTEKKYIQQFKEGTTISKNAHQKIGQIIGITGLLIGLAKRRKKKGVMLLAETDAHPLHLGVKGAKEILKILKQKLELNINPSKINKEVKELENEIKKITKELKINENQNTKEEKRNYIV